MSFDRDKITLDWNGKMVERKLEELAPKESPQQAAAPAPPATSSGTGVKALSSPAASLANDKNPQLGQDMGSGFRACVAGENSPAGTVLDGYRKVISQGLMGQSCFWEKVNK